MERKLQIRCILRKILLAGILAVLCTSYTVSTSAALKGYTISTKKVALYKTKTLKKRIRWISASTQLTLSDLHAKYVKVRCKAGGKTYTGYMKTSAVFAGRKYTKRYAKKKLAAYRRNSKSKSFGKIPKGALVQVMGKKGQFVQVIYTSGGTRRLAWITNKAASGYLQKKPLKKETKKQTDKTTTEKPADSGNTKNPSSPKPADTGTTVQPSAEKPADTGTTVQPSAEKPADTGTIVQPSIVKPAEEDKTSDKLPFSWEGFDTDVNPQTPAAEEEEEYEGGVPVTPSDESNGTVLKAKQTVGESSLMTGLLNPDLSDVGDSTAAEQAGKLTGLFDGVYYVSTYKSNENAVDFVLDIHNFDLFNEGNLEVCNKNGGTNQMFRFRMLSDGSYSIQNINSDLYLDKNTQTGNVTQYEWNGGKNQRWQISRSPISGMYTIRNKYDNSLLRWRGERTDGENVYTSESTLEGFNTCWTLTKVSEPSYPQVIPNGEYIIRSAQNRNYVLDVYSPDGFKGGEGKNLQLCTYNGGNNQRFTIIRKSYGILLDSVAYPTYVVSVDKNTNNVCLKSRVITYDQTQAWIPVPVDDGTIAIRSRYNGCYLDNECGRLQDENNVLTYHLNAGLNQRWILERVG